MDSEQLNDGAVTSRSSYSLLEPPESTGLKDLIERKRGASAFHVISNERAHIEELNALKQVIKDFQRYQAMIETAAPWRKLELLCQLEQLLANSGDYATMLLEIFALEVEARFAPAPPLEVLTEFAQEVLALRATEYCGIRVQKWVYAIKDINKGIPLNEALLPHQKIIEEGRGNFMKYIRTELIKRFEFKNKEQSKYLKYPVLSWLLTAMVSVAGGNGHFDYLGPHDWELLITLSPQKRVLQWTSIGTVVGVLVGLNMIQEEELFPKRGHVDLFQRIACVTLPRFGAQLTELQGVLEVEHARVTNIRAQMLTFGATALITLGHFAVRSAERKFQDDAP
mmetsp:Transcript_69758/g.154388  ORF Transcript_69758/g.154388 Transcript_69758/m.154388 type:complete len:339 (+) Transcript_69758:41-1057(+)